MFLLKSGNTCLLSLSSANFLCQVRPSAATVAAEPLQAVIAGTQEQEQLSAGQDLGVLLPSAVRAPQPGLRYPHLFSPSCPYNVPR